MTNDEIGKSKLFELLNQLQFTNIQFTEDIYNPIDAYAIKDGLLYSMEVKNRSRIFNDFILEEIKYKALYETLYSGCSNAFYINFIKSYCYIYSVTSVSGIPITEDYLPTDETKTVYKWKQTRRLPLDLTIAKYKYSKILKKWELI